jgi:hypothetical protein
MFIYDCPHGIIGALARHGSSRLQIPLHSHPGITNPMIPLDLTLLQGEGPKGRWAGKLVHNASKMLKPITKKFCGL